MIDICDTRSDELSQVKDSTSGTDQGTVLTEAAIASASFPYKTAAAAIS
jgi:hypothetical protein